MREPTITRNYAEALLELARRSGDLASWGELIDGVATAMQRDRKLLAFFESPRVSADEKNRILAKAYDGVVPRPFLRYLQALVRNRRQMLIPQIAADYQALVDEVEGRVHAAVTVAKETSGAERDVIARQLSRAFGKEVVPHLTVNPDLLGGLVVRVGDTVLDGSVKRRLGALRAKMLGGHRT